MQLFSPLYPMIVRRKRRGLLIPSRLTVLGIGSYAVLLPRFLGVSLSRGRVRRGVQEVRDKAARQIMGLNAVVRLRVRIPSGRAREQIIRVSALYHGGRQVCLGLVRRRQRLARVTVEGVVKKALE